jgi:hypothetical protein
MSLAENIALRLAALAATKQRRPTAVESGAIEARIHRLHAKGDKAPYIHKMLSTEFPNLKLPCRRTIQRTIEALRSKSRSVEDSPRLGRPLALTEAQEAEIVAYVDSRRDAHERTSWQHLALAAEVVLVQAGEAARLSSRGGNLKFSETWCRHFMTRHNIRRYAATSDRTVSAAEVAAAATVFFDALRPALKDRPPCRVYNMDEFFVLQAPSGRWTYQRRIAGVPVALRGSKLGFSAAVCSAADGSVLSIAVCHKGATHQVHVEIDDDLLTQYHRAESHFFSADTCGEWLDDFSSRIQRLHGDTRVVLLLDAATQHHAAVTARRAEGKLGDIVVVGIPPKMTHFFQQADQAIKACIVSS